MTQINNTTGLILVEKFNEHEDRAHSWTTVSMSEIHVNDIFRLGGRRGRVFRAVVSAAEGPIVEGAWQCAAQEIVFEKWD